MSKEVQFFNEQYNKQIDVIESLYEFHPEFFTELDDEDQEVLKKYYLLDSPEVPENIFEFRKKLIEKFPDIDKHAYRVYVEVLRHAGALE